MADGAPARQSSPTLPLQNGTATPETKNAKPASSTAIHNKLLDHVIRTPERQPSPQPTHLGVASTTGLHQLMSEEGPGYVAPKFEGKDQQKDQGKQSSIGVP